jgi:phosphoribosylanthranilate isomerase
MRVRVKVCGITRTEDARVAAAEGVDAVGLVFYEKSPRYVDLDAAHRIAAAVPPFVTRVGVFVDAPRALLVRLIRDVPLDAVQLHGDETPEDCRDLPARVIKGVRVRDADRLGALADYGEVADALLLDAWSSKAPGGTGETFDWGLARQVTSGMPVILAGGLNPSNVVQAIREVRPWGVDVSSGVESAPGIKDPGRIREFVSQCTLQQQR